MLVAEVPGLASDVLGGGPEHGALDRHPAMGGVIVAGGQETFDREAEQHDALVLTIQVPAWDLVDRIESRDRPDLEPDVLQFRPGSAEEFHSRADGQVEPVEATVERRERRAHDLAAAETPVSSVPRPAPGCGGGAGGAATRHDESLGGARLPGAASAARVAPGRTLAGMDGRLCSKVGCAREAVATLTYDYGDQMAALGPLGAANDPQAHDLCAPHADRLSVPAGWLVVRHEALRA